MQAYQQEAPRTKSWIHIGCGGIVSRITRECSKCHKTPPGHQVKLRKEKYKEPAFKPNFNRIEKLPHSNEWIPQK